MRLSSRNASRASVVGSQLRRFDGHTDIVLSVAFSSDSRLALSGSSDGTARLWEPATGRSPRLLTGNGEAIKAVAFTSNRPSVLTFSDDKIVHRWDSERGTEIDQRPVLGPRRAVRPGALGRSYVLAAAFAPDGRSILLGSQDKTMYLVALEGKPARARHFVGHSMPVFGVGFARIDGPVISHSQDGTVRVWDIASRREMRRLELGDVPLESAVAPDGGLVVASRAGGSTDMWDVGSGTRLGRLPGLRRNDAAHSLAFSADGRRLLAGLHSGEIYVGDLARKTQLGRLTGHTGAVMTVAFSPDGRFAISGGADHSVRVWKLFE